MKVWRKSIAAEAEASWVERLDARRLIVTAPAGSARIRLELYGVAAAEARRLVAEFGGRVMTVAPARTWLREPTQLLRIRDRLVIGSTRQAVAPFRDRAALVIPSGLAFGTGQHATTAGCLRLLLEAAVNRPRWSFLDLGSGSGILALAAAKLGAEPIEACDFDPAAIRVAEQNAERNDLAGRVQFHRRDLLRWQPRRTWDVVAANVYSAVLIAAAVPIASAVSPNGALILSGILRAQEAETLAAYQAHGFAPGQVKRREKWIAALLFRAGKTVDAPKPRH